MKNIAELQRMKQEFFSREGTQPPAPAETPAAGTPPAETVPAETTPEGEKPAGEETPPTPPDGETPETPPTEPETPPADEEEPETPPEGEATPVRGNKARLNLSGELDRLVAAYKQRNRDWTFKQCVDAAEKKLGIKPEGTPETPAAPADPNRPATVEATTARISELRAERRKANAELRMEDAGNISEQIEDLMAHRTGLERAAERQEQQQQTRAAADYNRRFSESESAALALYPAAADPNSALAKEMVRIEKDLEENDDPLYTSPDKPKKIAQMAAAALNIAPKRPGEPAAKPKVAAPAAPAKPKSVLPGGGSRTTPAAATPSVPAETARISGIKTIAELQAYKKSIGMPAN